MPRDYEVYLEDMLLATQKALRYAAGFSAADLQADEKTLDAIVRNLEIIGEAAKNVPAQVQARYPDIEWKKIAGLRDILIHQYFGIDVDIVWDILRHKLPDLQQRVSSILAK